MARVSYTRKGKGWRLRWREYPEVDGERRERSRSHTVYSDEDTARKVAVQITESLETTGTWERPCQQIRTPCNLEARFRDWLLYKRGRGAEASTLRTATSALSRFFAALRVVEDIDDGGIEAVRSGHR